MLAWSNPANKSQRSLAADRLSLINERPAHRKMRGFFFCLLIFLLLLLLISILILLLLLILIRFSRTSAPEIEIRSRIKSTNWMKRRSKRRSRIRKASQARSRSRRAFEDACFLRAL